MFTMDRRLVAAIVALALVLLVAGTAYLEREELVSASAPAVVPASADNWGLSFQQ